MATWRLHLRFDPSAAICRQGRFLPFDATQVPPSRSWGHPFSAAEYDSSASIFRKADGTDDWREDKELGNPAGIKAGDKVEITIIGPRGVTVNAVDPVVIFARAQHGPDNQGGSPFVSGANRTCLINSFANVRHSAEAWTFELGTVGQLPAGGRFRHFEFSVAAKINGWQMQLAHDPEVIVDMSSE